MIKGKALDISQLTPLDGHDINIMGTSNPEDLPANKEELDVHMQLTYKQSIEIAEEELAKGCGPGTHLEDGICVLDETTVEPASVSTGSVPTVGSTSLFYSITFTVLIAFAIMIILYLISRGSRTKTA